MTKAVSSILGGTKAPTPQPVPIAPTQSADDASARDAAARQAIIDRQAKGRRSTIAAGEDIALEEQQARGLFKAKQRESAAAKSILG